MRGSGVNNSLFLKGLTSLKFINEFCRKTLSVAIQALLTFSCPQPTFTTVTSNIGNHFESYILDSVAFTAHIHDALIQKEYNVTFHMRVMSGLK